MRKRLLNLIYALAETDSSNQSQ